MNIKQMSIINLTLLNERYYILFRYNNKKLKLIPTKEIIDKYQLKFNKYDNTYY
jgi:hypothetical protein